MEKLLEVKNLKVSFFTDLGEAQAVKDAGFAIEEGDFFGIVGESGSGKEILANYIHQRSDRREKPMITVNCAAFSENLIESELF